MPTRAAHFDLALAALANATRRDILRRALLTEEGVAEHAAHYPMSFAAVQKHIAMGMEEGLTQAVGQIDAILAEDAVHSA